jgi:hypothetical protein
LDDLCPEVEIVIGDAGKVHVDGLL